MMLTIKKHHHQHEGELKVQQLRKAPSDISDYLQRIIQTDMPLQHSTFFSDLPYFPLGVLDKHFYAHLK